MFRAPTLVLVLVFTGAVPRSASAQAVNCDTSGKNLYTRETMDSFYLWYERMPPVDPLTYASPEAYLDAVRYRPIDASFSWMTSRDSYEALFRNSQNVGIGMTMVVQGGELRIQQVFPDGPGAEAGMSRGDRIVEVNGRPVAALIALGQLGLAFGPAAEGSELNLTFVDMAGVRRAAHIVQRAYTIPTVSHTRVFQTGGRRVGYIFFRNFVEPSFAALDAAFTWLATERIDDLVLDLRYNGGGLVNVAQHLASYIGGVRTQGQVFAEYFHNDKQVARNRIIRFEEKPRVAPFERLIVITTRSSASASELVINALRPFMPVIVIGERTYGKPVGQYVFVFCDKALAPVTFSLRNANGQGDFFGGFAPDCRAADDLELQLGDPSEASLREALVFATTGACTPAPPTVQPRAEPPPPIRTEGWESVVNAR
jgi:C-terminal processing protease CtpA/Prc